jgi:hypothetical protein
MTCLPAGFSGASAGSLGALTSGVSAASELACAGSLDEPGWTRGARDHPAPFAPRSFPDDPQVNERRPCTETSAVALRFPGSNSYPNTRSGRHKHPDLSPSPRGAQ